MSLRQLNNAEMEMGKKIMMRRKQPATSRTADILRGRIERFVLRPQSSKSTGPVSGRISAKHGLRVFNGVLLVGILLGVTTFGNTNSAENLLSRSSRSAELIGGNPIDRRSAAELALQAALIVNMPEKAAVQNQVDFMRAEIPVNSNEGSIVSKPQVLSTDLKSRKDIIRYTTVQDDTVSSVAARFGVTQDSIRWSNELGFSDRLAPGRKLTIPPVNGIVYKVMQGDTPGVLATKFRADKDIITAFNDAEIDGLKVGELVVIPGGTLGRGFAWDGNSLPTTGEQGRFTDIQLADMSGRKTAPGKALREVKRGELIAYNGSTGFSTGPHLHFTVFSEGVTINPRPLIDAGRLADPAPGSEQSQGYGPANWVNSSYNFHNGLDLANNPGSPIYAADDGVIIEDSYAPRGYGHSIVIQGASGMIYRYGHLQR